MRQSHLHKSYVLECVLLLEWEIFVKIKIKK
jgi:hypothetical protein